MKSRKILFMTALTVLAFSASAEQILIKRTPLGSGTPGAQGYENARPVGNGLFIAPQYLPHYPTAATIWPRVVEVPCTQDGVRVLCEDYQWTPRLGRGEYLYFKPVVAQAAPPPMVQPPAPPRIIYREMQPRQRDRN